MHGNLNPGIVCGVHVETLTYISRNLEVQVGGGNVNVIMRDEDILCIVSEEAVYVCTLECACACVRSTSYGVHLDSGTTHSCCE